MQARLKSEVYEVWQYKTTVNMPLWVAACTEMRNGILLLSRRSGLQRILPNEWLVLDINHDVMWLTDRSFQRDYEVVAPG